MKNIVVVGRPNMGKSTLFNSLTGTKDAIVHNRPGVTRDVIEGTILNTNWKIFDTAGLETRKENILSKDMTDASLKIIKKADIIFFLVDGRNGLLSEDIEWAKLIRRMSKAKVLLIINKCEVVSKINYIDDFYKLGFGKPVLISAEHKKGFEGIYEFLENFDLDKTEISKEDRLKISILGQPNVGKSSFVNKVIGENRQIVKDMPGVTRDSVKILSNFYGRDIILTDTAGLRKKSNITDELEAISASKAISAISDSDIIVLIIDSTKYIENQSLVIASKIYDAGKILCIALNKWDLIDENQKEDRLLYLKHQFKNSFHQILSPLILPISSEKGTGIKNLFKRIYELWDISNTRVPTSLINNIVEKLVSEKQPPLSHLKRPMKIKFSSQIGINPIRIEINVSSASDIPESYTRYLKKGISRELNWEHIPVFINYKKSYNPYN